VSSINAPFQCLDSGVQLLFLPAQLPRLCFSFSDLGRQRADYLQIAVHALFIIQVAAPGA